ncbi:transposase [Candidatus Kuenenbacteria bacterium]|nr:transposase [Candidatus Kuenenbacteria bacterium]
MDELFQNKYRIKSIRRKNWNYAWPGYYFVTICVKGSEHVFGEVVDGKMIFNELGNIANQCWLEIPEHFPHVNLNGHQIMPNHVHGNLWIGKLPHAPQNPHAPQEVATRHGASLPLVGRHDTKQHTNKNDNHFENRFGPLIKKSLSSIINQYKGTVKRWANNNDHKMFKWQARFYDTIVPDQKALDNIRKYIKSNPEKWERDRNNLLGLYM